METTSVDSTGDVREEDIMNRSDTDELDLSSRIASIRESAQCRVLVAPPSYPGLSQRALTASLYTRLAQLVAFDA